MDLPCLSNCHMDRPDIAATDRNVETQVAGQGVCVVGRVAEWRARVCVSWGGSRSGGRVSVVGSGVAGGGVCAVGVERRARAGRRGVSLSGARACVSGGVGVSRHGGWAGSVAEGKSRSGARACDGGGFVLVIGSVVECGRGRIEESIVEWWMRAFKIWGLKLGREVVGESVFVIGIVHRSICSDGCGSIVGDGMLGL